MSPRVPTRRLTWADEILGKRNVRRYNTARPHRGINLDLPVLPTGITTARTERVRRVERADVLGGLIHEYRRAA
jgi:hypothetical protein